MLRRRMLRRRRTEREIEITPPPITSRTVDVYPQADGAVIVRDPIVERLLNGEHYFMRVPTGPGPHHLRIDNAEDPARATCWWVTESEG